MSTDTSPSLVNIIPVWSGMLRTKLSSVDAHLKIDGHHIYNIDVSHTMSKSKNKSAPQINKNNKTKPGNLMKKEYLDSYNELKKSITENQKCWKKEGGSK